MSADSRVEAVLAAAAAIGDRGERAAYVDQACAGDAGLRREVESLLEAHDEAGAFLQQPAPGAPLAVPSSLGPHVVPPLGGAAPEPPEGGNSNPLAEREGDRIGRYKLLEKIGTGGFGDVWMAEQEEPVRRRVALKVIKLGMDTREVIARFEAERQALALMDHPNIAKIHDGGATGTGRPYFVMELVRGIRITDYCDQNSLPTVERLHLFMKVCQAVQHAHQKGIIHRDLKPSNILVTVNDGVPVPKVIDFGIAKATEQRLTDKTVFTRFMEFLGTPAYMSPEQAELTSLDIDTRSDIYSLGVVLYELLTGRTPFDGRQLLEAGLDELRRIIREQEPPTPSARLSTLGAADLNTVAKARRAEPPKLLHLVRGDLDWIVMKCLEKDRMRRYETANGLAVDLQRHLNNEPVLAQPPSAVYRAGKFVRRHRVGVVVAACFVIVLIAATVVSTTFGLRATRAQATAVTKEREARAAETEAKATLQFFKDQVLAAGRPEGDGGLGRKVTLGEAVDAAEAGIQRAFTNHPLVEAEIRQTLGQTYDDLGDYKKAIQQQERALAIYGQTNRPGQPGLLRSMFLVADAYRKADRLPESIALFERMVASSTAVYGERSSSTVGSILGLANAYFASGRLQQAETNYLHALHWAQAAWGSNDVNFLRALGGLGNIYQRTGRLEEALQARRDVLRGRLATLGETNTETLLARANVASSLHGLGRWDEAIAMNSKLLKVQEDKYGPDHPATLVTLHNIGVALGPAGRLDEAPSVLERAFRLRTSRLGSGHQETLLSLQQLIITLQRLKQHTETVPLLSNLLHHCQSRDVPRNRNWLVQMEEIASTCGSAGQYSEAVLLREQILKWSQQNPGLDKADTLARKDKLAWAYLYHTNRFAEAEALFREVLVAQRGTEAAASPKLATTLAQLGLALLRQDKFVDAEPVLREAVPIFEKNQPSRTSTFSLYGQLGWSLLAQHKLAEAESWLIKAHDGLARRHAAGPSTASTTYLKETAERLVQLYEAWGKPDQAAERKRKLAELEQAAPVKPPE